MRRCHISPALADYQMTKITNEARQAIIYLNNIHQGIRIRKGLHGDVESF